VRYFVHKYARRLHKRIETIPGLRVVPFLR
jgi:hypothetical protein